MITFNDTDHSYINLSGEHYRSVTTILSKLRTPKNWDKIKEKYAKKKNLTIEQVTEMWNKETTESILKGKKYHSRCENEMINQNQVMFEYNGTTIPLDVFPSQLDSSNKKSGKSTLSMKDGIYPEVILWLDSIKLAGQADRVDIINNTIKRMGS